MRQPGEHIAPARKSVERMIRLLPAIINQMESSFITHEALCEALGATTVRQISCVSEACYRSQLLIRWSKGAWLKPQILKGDDRVPSREPAGRKPMSPLDGTTGTYKLCQGDGILPGNGGAHPPPIRRIK